MHFPSRKKNAAKSEKPWRRKQAPEEQYNLRQSDTVSTFTYGQPYSETVEEEPNKINRGYTGPPDKRSNGAHYSYHNRTTATRQNTFRERSDEYPQQEKEGYGTFRNDFSMESFDENTTIQPSKAPESSTKRGETQSAKSQSLTSSVAPSPRPSSLQRFMHCFVDDSCCGQSNDHFESIENQPHGRLTERNITPHEAQYTNHYPLKNRSNQYHNKESSKTLEKSVSEKYFEDYKRSQQCTELLSYISEDSEEYNRKVDRVKPNSSKKKAVKAMGLNEKLIRGASAKEGPPKKPISRTVREERINELVEFLSNSTSNMIMEEKSDNSSHISQPQSAEEDGDYSLNNLLVEPSRADPLSSQNPEPQPKGVQSRSGKFNKLLPYNSNEVRSSKEKVDDKNQSILTHENPVNAAPENRQKVKKVQERKEEIGGKKKKDDNPRLLPTPEKLNKLFPTSRHEAKQAKERREESNRSVSSKSSAVQRPVYLYRSL